MAQPKAESYIKWFGEIGIKDVPLVGGKTASLGEMFRELAPKGVKVPDAFSITAAAYWQLLRETDSINPKRRRSHGPLCVCKN